MKDMYARIALSAMLLVPLGILFPIAVSADTVGVNFENPPYVAGSINGQDGWASTGAYDQAVVVSPVISGLQSFRISDAVTSGAFGDQTFAKPLTDSVGESSSTNGTFSAGTKQTHFEMQFDLASATSTLQPGMHLSVSPDRGDGSRMSYLRFEDQADGIHVFFDDVTDPGPVGTVATFNETDIATISRSAHTIKLTLDVVDGPGNDVVKVYIDGSLVKTGTSWEDYYRYDPEAAAEQSPRIVKTVEFRESGTATPADAGNGFLIDNLSLLSGAAPASTVKVTIDKFVDGTIATAISTNSASFPMTATWNATNIGAGTGTFALGPVGFNSVNPYEAVTADMTPGASYTTNEVTGGSVVGTDCTGDNPYALVGYTTGDTLAAAQAATPIATVPNLTTITSNKFVIVWNKTCPVQVHIFKYVDGVQATALNAGGATFPMETTFDSPNLGSVTNAPFTLSPTGWGATDSAYEASFVGSNAGADYEADEVLGGSVVGATCDGTHTFSLVGYSTGDTLAQAQSGAQSLTPPSFNNLQSNKYVIVYNATCPTTGSLTVEKDTIGGNGTFSFTSDIPGHTSFSITTASGVGSQTFTGLTPGTYHVTEATQAGWTLTDNTECSAATVTAGSASVCVITNTKNPKLGEIRGTKYEDINGDGKLSNGDHHRLAGWTIYLDTNNNGVLDSGEPSSVTDNHGNYRFLSLPAGTYHVREVGQSGLIETVPSSGSYTIALGVGQIAKKGNFGNFHLGTISGMKYNDANGNGKKDSGEVGLLGWTINLKGPGPNGPTVSTTTDAGGNYSFTGLAAGTYTLSEVQQAGWHQTQHPSPIKVISSTNATKDNFGNTQRPLDSDGDYDGDTNNDHGHNDH